MYTPFNDVLLKSGETVQAGVVAGPDEEWQARIEALLAHKGEEWLWQISELLSQQLTATGRFYMLHRNGTPFCHILTAESGGVGLLGHVWTVPVDRGQSAASQLMALVMNDFRVRGGRALHLTTAYDSPAYHIYRKQGFESVEPASGVMAFFAPSQAQFEVDYFAPGAATVVPLDWHDWAVASPLLAGPWPGLVRCAPRGLIGRLDSEYNLMAPLRQIKAGGEPAVVTLRKSDSSAVVGLAAWAPDPVWPDTAIVDVNCHPEFWAQAGELLAALPVPAGFRQTAYAETDDVAKRAVLAEAGFCQVAMLPQRLRGRDVLVLER